MKKKKGFLLGLGITFVLSLVLEIGVFNFNFWMQMEDTTTQKNIVYYLDSMDKFNWLASHDGWISKGNQHLILKNINTKIENIQIDTNLNTTVEYILVFYTTSASQTFSNDFSVLCNEGIAPIDNEVKDIRIDISNKQGITLKDLSITINPMVFKFSLPRIIAVLLIYILGYGLFYIQKSPDYGV